jgi:hypothetical protein
MSVAYLNAKIDERATLSAAMENMLDKCAERGSDPEPEERAQLTSWGEKVKGLDNEIVKLQTALNANDKFEKTVSAVSELGERRDRAALVARETPPEPVELRLSEAFIESPAFTEYRGRGDGARFSVEDIFGLEERTTLTTANTYPPVQRIEAPAIPRIVTPFLSLINRERVSTGSFDYLVWSAAEGVALVAEGAVKPEVTLAPELETLSLDTYAGWVLITRQALEDVPRIRAQVEVRLRQALARELEAAAIAALVASGEVAVGADLAGVRSAVGEIQSAGYTPNAIALHPSDFGLLDIEVMSGGLGGPQVQGGYWGLTPVPVPSLTPGTAYVGDWNVAETWFDRGTTDVFISDSHADIFIRNTFIILAEARAAFAVTDPAAVAAVTITQPAPPLPLAAKGK